MDTRIPVAAQTIIDTEQPSGRAVTELVSALRALLGDEAVSTDLTAREQASVDGAPMSPILAAQLPLGLADLVVYVRDPDTVPDIIALAVRHRVPITPGARAPETTARAYLCGAAWCWTCPGPRRSSRWATASSPPKREQR